MGLITTLEGLLYAVSSALYLPVIALVSGLSVYVVYLAGQLAADALARARNGSELLEGYATRLKAEALKDEAHLDARLERLLQWVESEAIGTLDRIRFVIKIGPALGLMGTLIPMGISLASLAEGNVPKMAGSMVTAFTATVAGLACGVIAYLIAMVRETWLRADLREMEFATELAARGTLPSPSTPAREATDALSQTSPAL